MMCVYKEVLWERCRVGYQIHNVNFQRMSISRICFRTVASKLFFCLRSAMLKCS